MASGGARQRVLLKLSGEVLGGADGLGLDPDVLGRIATEIAEAARQGVETAIVVGGGNFLRGAALERAGIDRWYADQMGMLATVMNGIALGQVLAARGAAAQVFTAIPCGGSAVLFNKRDCVTALERGTVAILVGGTGNPYFTTDTCASLRAVELGATLLLKGTKVDGVYSGDPARDPQARRFDRISFSDVLAQGLGVMDATAIAMCREYALPIRVFRCLDSGSIRRALLGESLGTLVAPTG
ncbi:MAG: UMP kinase [Planctomycetota bacterium]